MPGYGGQEIALDVNDAPLDIVSPLAKVQAYQTQQNENQYRSALTDSVAQTTQQRAQMFPVQMQNAQNASAQNTAAWQREQLSRAMATIDPSDPNASAQWDSAMRKLASQGVSDASQYIGRYSPDRQQRLTAAYGADNAMSALANIGMTSTPDAQLTPEQTQVLDAQFSKMTPDQLQASYSRFEKIKDALNQVANSANPAQTWAQLAPQFGHNEPYSMEAYKNAWASVAPMDTYLRGRLTNAQAGVPTPVVHGPIEKLPNGAIVELDPITHQPTTIVSAPDRYQESKTAIGPDGKPLIIDTTTGKYVGENGPQALSGFVSQLTTGSENTTGNPAAKNPRSTATGNGQFVENTWIDLMNKNHPDLVQGKTRAQVLAMRSDPTLSAQVTAEYAQANAPVLEQAGVPVNSATLAAAHKLGPYGAIKVLTAAHMAPDTPMREILSPAAIKSNPQLANMTAGDYYTGIAKQFGTGQVDLTGSVKGQADPTLSGQDFLKTLPPSEAMKVQAIAEGRLAAPNPNSYAMRMPQNVKLMQDVLQYDPTFDAGKASARFATRKRFTAGPDADNITSLNTVIGHLADLDASIDGLRNSDFMPGVVNTVGNFAGAQMGDTRLQGAIANFNAKKTALASELTRALRGSGGSVEDVRHFLEQLDTNNSPTALHAAASSLAGVIASRVDAQVSKYRQGMSMDDVLPPGLSPHAIDALNAIRMGQAAGGGAPTQVASAATGRHPAYHQMSDADVLAAATGH